MANANQVVIGPTNYTIPQGTVTSVTVKGTSPITVDSESAITSSGTRTISHAASGVTAGTYNSVTVDATGHVTDGTNPATDVTITNGDKLVITDSSDSNKIAQSSLSFDGSTSTKCLTKAGTWEDFGNGAVTGVKGKTESTYSTGNVNITPAKVGAVDLEGDTMSGNLRIERTDPTNNAVVYLGNTSSTGINQYLLYNNGHSAAIRPETSSILTDDRKLYIPDKSGTIATIDDITPYYVFSTLNTSTNVANSTQVDKPPNVQVTSAGVYLVIAHVQFAQNANGIRELRITQSRSNSVVGISSGTTGPASNVTNSSISESYIFLANKNDTFGLRLYQSSGGTLAATWRELQVYRLSPIFMS